MPWGAGGAAGPMMTIGQGWAYVGERSWVSPEERGGKVGGEAAGGEGAGALVKSHCASSPGTD